MYLHTARLSTKELQRFAIMGDASGVSRQLAAGADVNAVLPASSGPTYTQHANPTISLFDLMGFETSALCVAAGFGHLAVVRLLLEAGADPNLADSNDITPLMVATRGSQVEALRLLVAQGVAVNATLRHPGASRGPRPGLHRAGAPDEGRDHTAFHFACEGNQPQCAEVLVRAGCNIALLAVGINGEYATGRQMAKDGGFTALVELLDCLTRQPQPLVGAVAEVRGLVGAAEHNGKRAAVRRHLPEKGRVELELLESGQTMAVKPANFELVVVPVGLAVEVRGLVGAEQHFNGQHGVVEIPVDHQCPSTGRAPENGRCGVRMPSRDSSRVTVRRDGKNSNIVLRAHAGSQYRELKPENLALCYQPKGNIHRVDPKFAS
jgi:hypothetical protein